ncbi:hypothetical protein VYU27_009892 [Nannochloropsis oceanica]
MREPENTHPMQPCVSTSNKQEILKRPQTSSTSPADRERVSWYRSPTIHSTLRHRQVQRRLPLVSLLLRPVIGVCLLFAVTALFFKSHLNASSSSASSTTAMSTPSPSKEQQQRARAKAAVLGAFVADAASCPLQWIYDHATLSSLLALSSDQKGEGWEGGKDPAFYPVPSCPYFTYPLGASSPYGDEILPLLRFLAGERGKEGAKEKEGFDTEGFARASFEFLEEYTGRLNHVSKLFVEARKAGKEGAAAAVDDSQAHGLVKVPLVVARYYRSSSPSSSPSSLTSPLFEAVESAVRVHQQNDLSVACSLAFAALLHRLIVEGGAIKDAVLWAETSVDSPLPPAQREILREVRMAGKKEGSEEETSTDIKGKLNREQIKEWGMSCALPGVWKGLLYAAMHATSYREAVTFNIWAGGDVCSRNIGIGALWGAAGEVGREEEKRGMGIPNDWREKTDVLEEVEMLVERVLGQ